MLTVTSSHPLTDWRVDPPGLLLREVSPAVFAVVLMVGSLETCRLQKATHPVDWRISSFRFLHYKWVPTYHRSQMLFYHYLLDIPEFIFSAPAYLLTFFRSGIYRDD